MTSEPRKTQTISGRAKRVEPAALTRHANANPDEISFLIELYRRELLLHCYRFTESLV